VTIKEFYFTEISFEGKPIPVVCVTFEHKDGKCQVYYWTADGLRKRIGDVTLIRALAGD